VVSSHVIRPHRDKAFTSCHAANLKPYEPYFPAAELYDDGGGNFNAALETSLDELSGSE
jgi:hypothetical protein